MENSNNSSPKQSDDTWLSYFEYDNVANNTKCKQCNSDFKGFIKGNLKRHLIDKHKNLAVTLNVEVKKRKPEENSEVPKRIKKVSRGEYISECIKMVAFHYAPFSMLDFPSFRRLTECHASTIGLVVNSHNIIDFIKKAADGIRELIKDEIKNRLISTKLDIASRHGRSMLAVNTQFFSPRNNSIAIRTLSARQLKKCHTGSYLCQEVESVLKMHSVDKRNIYTYCSDNGRNVISVGKLLKNMQSSLFLTDDIINTQKDLLQFEDDEANETESDEETEFGLEEDDLLKNLKTEDLSILTISPCAPHTLQLTVQDSLRELKSNKILSELRSVVKNLSLDRFRQKFKNVSLPKIDVVTL
jgi:hypothetical protein